MASKTYEEMLEESFGSSTTPKMLTTIDSNADQVDLQEGFQNKKTYEEMMEESFGSSSNKPVTSVPLIS